MFNPLDIDARLAVADTIHRFYRLIDTGRASHTIALFTRDAELTFGPGSPKPGIITGDAIGDAMRAREMLATAFTRHCICNLMLEPAANAHLDAHYLMILFRSDDSSRDSTPAFVADVDEQWRSEEGHWKIAKRVLTPTFFRP